MKPQHFEAHSRHLLLSFVFLLILFFPFDYVPWGLEWQRMILISFVMQTGVNWSSESSNSKLLQVLKSPFYRFPIAYKLIYVTASDWSAHLTIPDWEWLTTTMFQELPSFEELITFSWTTNEQDLVQNSAATGTWWTTTQVVKSFSSREINARMCLPSLWVTNWPRRSWSKSTDSKRPIRHCNSCMWLFKNCSSGW